MDPRRLFASCSIKRNIVLSHARCGKPFFESRPNLASIQFVKSLDRLHGFVLSVHNEASYTILNDLWHRAGAECNDRCSASHRLYHHKAKRLRPIDRE